ncbi:hypothetical protein HYW75_04925 [Candidatus Pacearchaeota archaeon]|nr:hypothetical protein [Candidatus Pacearchaeota archaeon]
MVDDKEITILNLNYQDFLTYLSINLTVSITIVVGYVFYELVAWVNQSEISKISGLLSIFAIIIISLAIHFWFYYKKEDIKKDISRKFNFFERSKRYIPTKVLYSKNATIIVGENKDNANRS